MSEGGGDDHQRAHASGQAQIFQAGRDVFYFGTMVTPSHSAAEAKPGASWGVDRQAWAAARLHRLRRIPRRLSAQLVALLTVCASSGATPSDYTGPPEAGNSVSTSAAEYAAVRDTRSRYEILAAAATWMEAPVAYSRNPALELGGYRRDSAGYTSMAWGLPPPGLTVAALASVAHPITKHELRPGDVLLRRDRPGQPGHAVIFERWNDDSKSSYVAFEQPDHGTGRTTRRVIAYPYGENASAGYRPYTYRNSVDGPLAQSQPAHHGVAAFSLSDGRFGYLSTTGGHLVVTRQGVPSAPWMSDVHSLGVTATGTPAVLLDQQNQLSVIVRTDGAGLVRVALDDHGDRLSKIIEIETRAKSLSDPVTAFDSTGRHNYVVRAEGGALRHGSENNPGGEQWSAWEMTTTVAGEPATAMNAWHMQHYLARTEHGKLVHGWLTPTDGWHRTILPVDVTGDPVLILDSRGALHFLVRSSHHTLMHGWQTLTGTGPWATEILPPQIAGDPAAVLSHDGSLTYFARTDDDALIWGKQASTGEWSPPTTLIHSGVTGNPAALRGADGRLAYFVPTSTAQLLYGTQNTAGSVEWHPPVPV